MKLFKGVLIFFIALIPTVIFSILGIAFSFVYHLLTLKWKQGLLRSGAYFYQMGLAIDQFGNVSMHPLFNLIMVKRKLKFHPFGDEDDTLSYVFAMNYNQNTLNKFGLFWANFLNFVDKNHLEKALINKIKRDKEAFDRYNNYSINI